MLTAKQAKELTGTYPKDLKNILEHVKNSAQQGQIAIAVEDGSFDPKIFLDLLYLGYKLYKCPITGTNTFVEWT